MDAVPPHEWGSAHAESHAHRGFVDVDGRKGLRAFRRRNGVANGHPFRPGDGHDVPDLGLGHLNPLHTAEHKDAVHVMRASLATAAQQDHILPRP